MAKEVIRQDVIEISIDSKDILSSLTKITQDIENLKKKFGGVTSDVDGLKRQFEDLGNDDGLNKTRKQTEQVKKSVGDTTDEADKLKNSFKDISNTSFSKVTAGLKKVGSVAGTVAKTAVKTTAAGVGAAATGVATLVGLSVRAYSDTEQLIGGVETLFGAGGRSIEDYAKSTGKSTTAVKKKYESLMSAQKEVLNNSNKAFKTAGLSANDYMETVTGFSASLIASLGGDTKKAASYTDKAIVDMSDNANKMGTDMESIQNAYQGFAKQNYTMLDNLKLGYGGTQEEMKRLIKDASKIDKTVKANDMSFGNIILAIHAIQDSLDITGTTSKEASKTIQGSFASMQSAWGNLMTSLVVGGDSFDQCLGYLVKSAKTFGDNVMPAIEKGLKGVGSLITGLAPYVEAELPGLVSTLLPPLLDAATSLITGLIKSTPVIIGVLKRELPGVVKQIGKAVVETFGTQIPSLSKFGEKFIKNANVIAKVIPYLLGGLVAFKAVKPFIVGLKSVAGLFSKSDEEVSNITGPLKNIAKANVKTVLKGMANIAIIVGGFTLITTAVIAVSPYIANLSDMRSLIKVASAITILGVVGTALAGLSGIVGNIPVLTVVKGLANMAIMIAGMSALYLVVGTISSSTDFGIKKMLEFTAMIGVLGTVGSVLSVFAGVVGTIPIPVVLLGLANIALVLTGVTGIITAFGALSKIPGFDDFMSSGGDTLANIFKQVGKMIGSLAGGVGEGVTNSLPAIGINLTAFVLSLKPALSMFKGVDVKSIGSFFTAIGGFVLELAGNSLISKFTGGIHLSELGTALTDFAYNSVGFFAIVSGLPANGFSNAKLLFQSLKDIGNVPNTGGVFQWFVGEKDFDGLSNNLPKFGNAMSLFYKSISGISDTTKIENLFSALGSMGKAIPNTGGVFQWFTGENDLSGLSRNLPTFGEAVAKLYSSISSISDFGRIESLFNSLKSASGIESITTLVNKNIDEIVQKVSELPRKMGDALRSSGESLSTALVEIWKKAVISSAVPVNKLLSGANWILQELGSSKRLTSWTPYAKGTDGHKGGNALVNDGRGAELVQMPNGNTFIPKGKNVFIPNAPVGMKVLSAENTAQVMGRKNPTFRYAKGNIDIWEYMDNAGGLVSAVTQKYVNYNGLKGTVLNIGKGLVSTVGGEMTNWVKKMFDEFGALSLANYNPAAGVEQWRSTVIKALKMEGQYSDANVKRTLYQMQTESGGNPKAINLWDSNAKKGTPSKGLMQVIDPTFAAYARAPFNKNIYDPLSNILASVRYAVSRYGSLAKAYQGHGYANGGIATKPSIFGEAGAEMAIPLTQNKRGRALGLWQKTGSILGAYTPENSPTLGSTNNSDNTYVCNFNITVNGGDNSRQTARSTKRAVKEAFEEFMNDFGNRNKPIREW